MSNDIVHSPTEQVKKEKLKNSLKLRCKIGNAKLCNKIHLFYIYYIKLSFKNHNITQKSFRRKYTVYHFSQFWVV